MQITYQQDVLQQLLALHEINPISTVNVNEADFKTLWELVVNSGFSFKEGDNWIDINNMFSIHLDVSEPDINESDVSIISTY